MVVGFVTRKVLHVLFGLLLLAALQRVTGTFGIDIARIVAVSALALLVLVDVIRIVGRKRIPLFQFVLKDKESQELLGLTFAVASATILIHTVDVSIAIAALLMLIVGDPSAALSGKFLGRGRKSVIGTIACYAMSTAAGVYALGWSATPLVMAAAATVGERYAGDIDDNLTMPLAAGVAGQLMVFLF